MFNYFARTRDVTKNLIVTLTYERQRADNGEMKLSVLEGQHNDLLACLQEEKKTVVEKVVRDYAVSNEIQDVIRNSYYMGVDETLNLVEKERALEAHFQDCPFYDLLGAEEAAREEAAGATSDVEQREAMPYPIDANNDDASGTSRIEEDSGSEEDDGEETYTER